MLTPMLNLLICSRFVIRKNSFWDKLVFHKIQKLLGGNIDLVVSASAPLEKKVMDFVRCAFGCVVRIKSNWIFD